MYINCGVPTIVRLTERSGDGSTAVVFGRMSKSLSPCCTAPKELFKAVLLNKMRSSDSPK